MIDFGDDENLAKHAEEFLQLFNKGAAFTQALLKENEQLRYQLLKAGERQATAPVDSDSEAQLEQKIADLERERQEIFRRIKEVEAENLDFANRYVEIEEENNKLANLYIASYQLHSTLDFKEVLQIVSEIIINLIGAEVFAVLLRDEKSRQLEVAVHEGVDSAELPLKELDQGIIGEILATGDSYFADDIDSYVLDYAHPMVSIPLKIKDLTIGVIVIYRMLEQKQRFADVDYELFTLLAGHAATAIFSSRMYSDSERKLSTIQGFIDLLTK
ncbi:MAG: GAF domain-containing protein [Desulfuromonadaceae bacterium]